MNIIKQIKDGDGNNIYPIGYAQGGMKMDLLWTNSAPTRAFASQTISLDLTDYNYVYIIVKATTGEAYYSSFIVEVGGAEQLICVATTYLRKRNASVTASGVTFDGGYNQSSVSAWEGNTSSAIPYQIYGIKLSYIVPTSVHGLQYVEV